MPPALMLGVLASGEGTTLEGLADAFATDPSAVRIAVVISDRPGARVLERAQRRALPTAVVPLAGPVTDAWADRVTAELVAHHVDLIVLAGFLPILPPSWVERWQGRAINTHPSLLPRHGGRGMYGRRVHEAVLAAGDRETGATVHLVTNTLDGGPAVAQERMAVAPGDTPETLRARVRPLEVSLLAATILRFADRTLPLPYPEDYDRGRRRAVEPRG
jgi:phosphoribosylglycinamide formyltransferase 1